LLPTRKKKAATNIKRMGDRVERESLQKTSPEKGEGTTKIKAINLSNKKKIQMRYSAVDREKQKTFVRGGKGGIGGRPEDKERKERFALEDGRKCVGVPA